LAVGSRAGDTVASAAPEPEPAPAPAPPPAETVPAISKPEVKIEPVVEPKIAEAPAATATKPKSLPNAGDLVSKQKLDCALQLARTVSLDFNNALTSILGHTFVFIEQGRGRTSVASFADGGGEISGAAAEVAHELQTFSRQEKRRTARRRAT